MQSHIPVGPRPDELDLLEPVLRAASEELWRHARELTGNEADADDLVQEIWLHLLLSSVRSAREAVEKIHPVLGVFTKLFPPAGGDLFLTARRMTALREGRNFRSWVLKLQKQVFRRMQKRKWFRIGFNLGHGDWISRVTDGQRDWECEEDARQLMAKLCLLLPSPYGLWIQTWVEQQGNVKETAEALGLSLTDFLRGLRRLGGKLLVLASERRTHVLSCFYTRHGDARDQLRVVVELLGFDPDVDLTPPCDPLVVLVMRFFILAMFEEDIADPSLLPRLFHQAVNQFFEKIHREALRPYLMPFACLGAADASLHGRGPEQGEVQ